MDQIFAPFTPEQVEALNEFQKSGIMHPFTCGPSKILHEPQIRHPECEKSKGGEGILIATKDGWVCPCGNFTQNWAHAFMADKEQHSSMQRIRFNAGVAVIVGRFQTNALTVAHSTLISYAQQNYAKTFIFIGQHRSQPTVKNPLSFELRKKIVQSMGEDLTIDQILDCRDDEQWSLSLDELIKKHIPDSGVNVTLLGSRDSFIQYYKGAYPTKEIELNLPDISASKAREYLKDKSIYDQIGRHDIWSFTAGVIHAICSRHPSPFIAVDIAIVKQKLHPQINQPSDYLVLMGRKKQDGNKYRFIGGFVDSSDESITSAAHREVVEETGGNLITDRYTLAGEAKIDDWRYKGAPENIFSNFFICRYVSGEPVASDDIDELIWCNIPALKPYHVVKEHHRFLQILQLHDFHFSPLFA